MNNDRKKFLYVISGVVSMIFLGLIYAWSLFVTPLEKEFGWTSADTALIFTISLITFCLGSIIGGLINEKVDGRKVLFVIALCEFAGFYISSYVTELLHIYISYGIICGFATGIAYNTIIGMITLWFPNRIGLISGILMMGFGLGAFILGSVVNIMIENIGWRSTFKILAVSFGIIITISSVIIKSCKNKATVKEKNTEENKKSYTPSEMIKTKIFWKIFIWDTLICSIGMNVISNVSPCILSLNGISKTAVIAVGCISLANGIGRVIFGSLYDNFGKQKTIFVVSMCSLSGSILSAVGIYNSNICILITAFIIVSISYSGLSPATPVFAKSVFGRTYYTTNFSIIASAGIPASLIGSYLMGIILTKTGLYMNCFVLNIAISAAGVLLSLNIAKEVK